MDIVKKLAGLFAVTEEPAASSVEKHNRAPARVAPNSPKSSTQNRGRKAVPAGRRRRVRLSRITGPRLALRLLSKAVGQFSPVHHRNRRTSLISRWPRYNSGTRRAIT
jgi:hypothetical protein